MQKGVYSGLAKGLTRGTYIGLTTGLSKGQIRNDRKARRMGIDAEYTNGANEVLFIVQGDSTTLDTNNSTGAGPANNGKLWNGSKFVNLGTVGPGVGTTDGSFLQQFAVDYYKRTGKIACFVDDGVGGTKVFDTWDGVSSTFTTSIANAKKAKLAGNFPNVRFLLAAGVNDSTAGDTAATVITNFGAWINAINTAFPLTKIYCSMFGVKSAQTTRAQVLRCGFREKWIATSNLHMPFFEVYLNDYGLIGADGVHPTQTGHNFRGAKWDSYLELERANPNYSKFALSAMNSYKTTAKDLGANRRLELNNLIGGLFSDGIWSNITACFLYDCVDVLDRFVDHVGVSVLTDRGVTVTTDASITTNTGQTLNMPCTPAAVPWRTHANIDTFIYILFRDVIAAPAGSTKIAAGVSTGTSIFAAQQSTAGLITFFVWGNTGPTKSGGYQDDTSYAWGREGTAAPGGAGGDVVSWINGTENARLTAAAGTANSTGPEIGDRYTAGPAGFALNAEYKVSLMGLGSAVDQAKLDLRIKAYFSKV